MKKYVGRTEGNKPAGFEQGDARGQEQGFADVVGNEDNGFAETPSQRAEFALQLGAGNGVERAEGFVHEEDGRVGSKGAGDTDALALAAGEFARVAFCEFAGLETDEAHHFHKTREPFGWRPIFEVGNKRDVFCNREVREKPSFLNDITDAAAQADGIPVGGGATVDEHCSRGGKQESIDELEERGLAAAATSEEDEGFGGGNAKRNIRNKRARGSAVSRRSATGDTAKLDDRFDGGCEFRIHFG